MPEGALEAVLPAAGGVPATGAVPTAGAAPAAGAALAEPATQPPRRTRLSPYRIWFTASIVAMLAVWFGLTGSGLWPALVSPTFLPSPADIVATFVTLATKGYQGQSLLAHIGVSAFRFGAGFAFCLLVAVPLGLAMGMSERVQGFFDPIIEFWRPIPKIALIPLLIIWFGIGELSKTILIVLALFPILTISGMQAVKGVNRRKIQAALSLGASRRLLFWRVVLPSSLPAIFTAIRVCIGVGITTLVAAEMIATTNGIAWIALNAADFLQTDTVLAAVFIMSAMGFLLDALTRRIERRLVHWAGKGA